MRTGIDFLGIGRKDDQEPITGAAYLAKLHKYLKANLPRLAPSPRSASSSPTILGQSYTLLTLGLDPSSQPLSRNVKVPLTLGFGTPLQPKQPAVRPLLLRLPPDRLLYLLLRWQSLPQALSHVGHTDVPIEPGVPVAARGARVDARESKGDGDVASVRSWVGSMRSVSIGSLTSRSALPGMGWLGQKEEMNEGKAATEPEAKEAYQVSDQILLALYSMFTVIPALLIHPPFMSDPPIVELIDAGGYTQLGGIDVRVPLDILRNLQILELESYDPRGLLIPQHPGLRSLTVRDVQDGDDWIEELLIAEEVDRDPSKEPLPRFPNLRHLSLQSTSLLSLPTLPLSRLTSLDLSFNLLNGIPTALASLHSLQSLNLSNNLISSVRNAPTALGNVTSLNIAKNRIDCLVGLERVLGLERIDVRSNELSEPSEVGRLAVLPYIKEIWCANNTFDQPTTGDEWRSELGYAFTAEGKEVILDDTPFTWVETRRIESMMSQSGQRRPAQGRPAASTTPQPPHTHKAESPAESSRGPEQGLPDRAAPTFVITPPLPKLPAPPSSAQQHKKRRPRRVINLDEGERSDASSEVAGGSLRLPLKAVEEGEQGGPGSPPEKQAGRRGRVSASMFEPSTGPAGLEEEEGT